MQQRALGATGLKVSRLGLGTLTWGRDTDEHEARDQLIAFAEAGGTLLDTAAGYGDGASEELIGTLLGDVVARDDVVLATKAGISPTRRGAPRDQRLPRRPDRHPRPVPGPAPGRPRRPLAGAHLGRRHPARGDAERARLRRGDRPGVVRRDLELLRLADRAGGHLAAGGARPGADRLDAGRVLPAQPRASSTRSLGAAEALGLGVLPWSPLGRGVLTGKYRTGTPADSRAASPHFANFVGTYLNDRSQRVVEAVVRAAEGLDWSPIEVALVWVRDRPGVTAAIVGARTAAQLQGVARDRRARPARRDHGRARRRVRRGLTRCPLPPDELTAPVWSGSSTSWSCRVSSAATW